MIDVGDTVTLIYPTKPASPGTVTVTIGLPDGTASTPTAAPSGSYTYTTVQPGRHTVLWVATGPDDAYSDVFDVAPQDPGSLISLADVKAQFRITQSTDDEELRLYIASATALVEHEVGAVIPTSHTEIVDSAQTIVLAKAPVISVTSIVSTFPFPDYPLTLPTYLLEGPPGILRQQPFFFADWGFDGFGSGINYRKIRLTITYQAGRQIIPAPLQVATRMIVENLWESRRLAQPKPATGDETQTVDREIIPERALALMAPYRRAPY
jgi:uncharacterized phiE125 gp8 family phage protein